MMLICGSAQDCLIQEVLSLGGKDQEIVQAEETDLFNSCAVALRRTSRVAGGFLTISGRRIQMEDLDAVVVRLPRDWYPNDGFDLQDQMFVYHETIAAWFAVFEALHCPVINRFGLGWWLHDLAYPVELRNALAKAIGLPATATKESHPGIHRLYPTKQVATDSVTSVYRAGGRSFLEAGSSRELLAHLTCQEAALLDWERDTGIALSRIDFEHVGGLRVEHVEVFPLFDEEQQALTRDVAEALLRSISVTSKEAV